MQIFHYLPGVRQRQVWCILNYIISYNYIIQLNIIKYDYIFEINEVTAGHELNLVKRIWLYPLSQIYHPYQKYHGFTANKSLT